MKVSDSTVPGLCGGSRVRPLGGLGFPVQAAPIVCIVVPFFVYPKPIL